MGHAGAIVSGSKGRPRRRWRRSAAAGVPDFDRQGYTDRARGDAQLPTATSTSSAWRASARARPVVLRSRSPDGCSTPTRRCCPKFRGWHAVRDALEARRDRHGAARCTSRPRSSTTGRSCARRRSRSSTWRRRATLHERIKEVERALYPATISLVRAALDRGEAATSVAATGRGAAMRALLSVYDKRGTRRSSPRACATLGVELVASGGTAEAFATRASST
jgi:hypothetical protein